MPKYFVIIHVPGEQPLFGTMTDQPDRTCAETNFVAQEAKAGRYESQPCEVICVKLEPTVKIGDPQAPSDFEHRQMLHAWKRYLALPGAQRINPDRVSA